MMEDEKKVEGEKVRRLEVRGRRSEEGWLDEWMDGWTREDEKKIEDGKHWKAEFGPGVVR
jgi:hypothetical protein